MFNTTRTWHLVSHHLNYIRSVHSSVLLLCCYLFFPVHLLQYTLSARALTLWHFTKVPSKYSGVCLLTTHKLTGVSSRMRNDFIPYHILQKTYFCLPLLSCLCEIIRVCTSVSNSLIFSLYETDFILLIKQLLTSIISIYFRYSNRKVSRSRWSMLLPQKCYLYEINDIIYKKKTITRLS